MTKPNHLDASSTDDIRQFLPGVALEIAALAETRCPHDRKRALKAIRHLESLVAALKSNVESFRTSDQGPALVVDNDPER
ncbi:hypothetical protein [Hyphomicrobium sp. CS1BSMeth3]|uniref:hypothetical protein n=1 Tax=Hyphomicrobium sp. CS1BSMeth3 TaxID=1892844 RepID=UPI0009311079|nr:hypothetical protein [Hyphomicrobium sp. CS1BSMeth3]